jgi:hypothetical protein
VRASEMAKLAKSEPDAQEVGRWFDMIIKSAKEAARERGATWIKVPAQPGKAFALALNQLRDLGYSISRSVTYREHGSDDVTIDWTGAGD